MCGNFFCLFKKFCEKRNNNNTTVTTNWWAYTHVDHLSRIQIYSGGLLSPFVWYGDATLLLLYIAKCMIRKKCWFLNKPIKILFFKILQLAMYRRRRVVTPYNTKGKSNPPSVYLYKILFFKSDHTKTWHFYSLETLCAWTLKILPPLTKHIY